MIGHKTRIYTATHNFDTSDFKYVLKTVNIMDNVVIFPDVLIMPGVTIGKNAVVFPGAVVTKDIPESAVVAGVPAKKISTRKATDYVRHQYFDFFPVS